MNGAAGKTNGNYLGVNQGYVPLDPYALHPDPWMHLQNLIFTLQNLLGELNRFPFSKDVNPQGYRPGWTPNFYPGPTPWSKMYHLSNLLGTIRTQIQGLENNMAQHSLQNIQGTVEGLNLAAQSLQTSQVLRRMDSIINEMYQVAYQKQPGS